MKRYTLYLDDFMDDLFFEMENISDGGVSHRCEIQAKNRKRAAEILSVRLKKFLMQSFEEDEPNEEY